MAAHVQDQLLNCIDLLLDAVFLVDADGRVKYVNAACERIFGYTPDELIGCKLIDLVLPEERARTLEEAARIMAGQPRVGFVNRYRHKDGTRTAGRCTSCGRRAGRRPTSCASASPAT